MDSIICQPIAEVTQLGARIVSCDLTTSSAFEIKDITDVKIFIKSKNTKNDFIQAKVDNIEKIESNHLLLKLVIDEHCLTTKLLWFDEVNFKQEIIPIEIKIEGLNGYSKIIVLPIKCLYLDCFDKGIFKDITYSLRNPKYNINRHPLIICLHGAGEGGNNQSNLLADRLVINFLDNKNLKLFDDPYILAPQCPTFWLDKFTINGRVYLGERNYTEDLLKLIKNILDSHSDIDINRVYIIGSSMGGYQGLQLLALQPNLFAGGIISCPAKIPSKDILNKLNKVPLWFIHSNLDTLVPVENTQKILEYLRQKNHPNCNVTYYSHIFIQGKEIFSHCVFLYVYENDPKNESFSIYEWLKSQRGVNYVDH